MKIVTDTPNGWKAIIGAVSTIAEEALFTISPEGIKFGAIDTSKISYISFNWDKSKFTEFDVKEEIKIGVSLKELSSIIKRAKDKVVVEDSKGGLTLRFSDKIEFTIPTLANTATIEKEPPKIEYDVSFQTTKEEIDRFLGDADIVSKHFEFETKDNGLFVFAKEEFGQGEMREVIDTGKPVKQGVKSSYSIIELQSILGTLKPYTDKIDISFSTHAPLQLDFNIPEMGVIKYLLAPRNE